MPKRPPTVGVVAKAVVTDGVKDRAPLIQTFLATLPTQPTAPAQEEPKAPVPMPQPNFLLSSVMFGMAVRAAAMAPTDDT